MMRREGGRVVIEISEEEFSGLLLMMGYAIGAAESENIQEKSAWAREYNQRDAWLRLANAINEGNPNYTPYAVPEPKAS